MRTASVICGFGESCETLASMDESDVAVGQRLAELRRQKELRQEDFIALLEARGIKWTQTVLSRVEGGKRALKATEAFAAADALGVDVGRLNPSADSLDHRLKSLNLKYREARIAADRAAWAATVAGERLVALMLANEIRCGRSTFTVHGAPHQFLELVAEALAGNDGLARIAVAHDVVGINTAQVERELDEILAADYPDLNPAEDQDDHKDEYIEAEKKAYLRVFADWLPSLEFVEEPNGRFWVDEIDVPPTPPAWVADLAVDVVGDLIVGGKARDGG